MPRHFKVYDGAYAHFVTSTIVYWIPVFCRDDYFRVLVDSLQYCCSHKGLSVHGFVLMPNHFHMVGSQADGDLSGVMRDAKKYTAKKIADKLQEDGRLMWLRAMQRAAASDDGVRVWDEGFHPEQVHKRDFFEQKLAYMHDNPVRAGFVADPCSWKYSSAGFYYLEEKPAVPVTPIAW